MAGILIFLTLAIGVLALTIRYTADCEPAAAVAGNVESMQAVVYRCYGSPDVLNLEAVSKPVPAADELLVRVHAASVNPLDWHYMRGSPYIMRLMAGIGAPDDITLGVDFAGVVEAVGEDVSSFSPGDAVFGGSSGAFAEYITVRDDRAVVSKPANVSFEQAAAVPIAAVTALQALRDHGMIRAGEKVLINGASGGVGTFAVQIAKSMGVEVTGVCSTRNVDLVRSIGADHVIDYKKESYPDADVQYDVIVDMVGNHSMAANRRALAAEGRYIIVGGEKGDWIGPLKGPLKAAVIAPFVDQTLKSFTASMRRDDLVELARLMEEGKLTSVIDRRFSLAEVPAAVEYSESGRARGKIIIDIETQPR
jgi:NADPH:quinone reductase-like Zn-dependent oxidoreductase